MDNEKTPILHSTCPKCHLPVKDGESWIQHEGHSYHSRCAPEADIAGKKDNPYPDRIAI